MSNIIVYRFYVVYWVFYGIEYLVKYYGELI